MEEHNRSVYHNPETLGALKEIKKDKLRREEEQRKEKRVSNVFFLLRCIRAIFKTMGYMMRGETEYNRDHIYNAKRNEELRKDMWGDW